jgi:hypothetical protein
MADDYSVETINKIRNIPIVFIVGLGRSGTTLLQELMNAHPNIVAPPEYSFIIYLYQKFGSKKNWAKKDVLDFIEALYFRPLFSLWLIKKEDLTKKLLAIVDYLDYALVCKMIFSQMTQGKENVLLFCDKNPENSLLIKTLLKIFPEARFIHMLRDPRDNINSQIKTFKKKNAYFTARRWYGYNMAIENVKLQMPDKFFTVYYEKLAVETEAALMPLCDFLKIPFNKAMIENHFPERLEAMKDNKLFNRVKRMHQSLANPVNSSNIGKWEKEMSPENIAITEIITGTLAHNKYGYSTRAKNEIKERVSGYKLFKSWVRYQVWELYTRFRYKSYAYNKFYYKRKIRSRPLGA